MEYLQFLDTGLLTAFCSLIFWFSHQSGFSFVPSLFPHQDKLAHLSEYAFLGIVAWRCFRHLINKPQLLFIVSLGFCSLYGAVDEFHQYFIPSRTVDLFDWLADTMGAGLSIGFLTMIRLRQEHQQSA